MKTQEYVFPQHTINGPLGTTQMLLYSLQRDMFVLNWSLTDKGQIHLYPWWHSWRAFTIAAALPHTQKGMLTCCRINSSMFNILQSSLSADQKNISLNVNICLNVKNKLKKTRTYYTAKKTFVAHTRMMWWDCTLKSLYMCKHNLEIQVADPKHPLLERKGEGGS